MLIHYWSNLPNEKITKVNDCFVFLIILHVHLLSTAVTWGWSDLTCCSATADL